MKKTISVVAMLVTAVCATMVWSQGNRSSNRTPRTGTGGRMMMSCPAMAVTPPRAEAVASLKETLGLKQDQVTKLTDILTKGQSKLTPLSQKATEACNALRTAVYGPGYNAENVTALAAKAEKAEANVVSAGIQTWTQVRSVLTSEQASKLQQAMTRGPGGMGGPRPGDPPPLQ